MEEIKKYKLSNGTELVSKANAELGQSIINSVKELRTLTDALKDLKQLCTCEEKVKAGAVRKDTRTEENHWGDSYGVVYTSQPYLCKVCGADWYHHIEDNQWFKW